MAYTNINGIKVHYQTIGSGPPILMMAPGGLDSNIERWSTSGVWTELRPLETITDKYTCIVYDRREAGKSGGKVERITWSTYANEAKGLLDHLGIERAFVLGGCLGCSVAIAFAAADPECILGLLLHWPVGGARWRAFGLKRFRAHLDYVNENGLDAVVRLSRAGGNFLSSDMSLVAAGPWCSTIANDEKFAREFADMDPERYAALVDVMGRTLFDRDTAPGAESEELMALKVPALIIPGNDQAHATSAARYLEECLPQAKYHDIPLDEQTPDRVREWILDFLDAHAASAAG